MDISDIILHNYYIIEAAFKIIALLHTFHINFTGNWNLTFKFPKFISVKQS